MKKLTSIRNWLPPVSRKIILTEILKDELCMIDIKDSDIIGTSSNGYQSNLPRQVKNLE